MAETSRLRLRKLTLLVSIIATIVAIICGFEPYASALISIVGTFYWVRSTDDNEKLIRKAEGFQKYVKKTIYYDSVLGGGMVGVGVVLTAISQIKSDFSPLL